MKEYISYFQLTIHKLFNVLFQCLWDDSKKNTDDKDISLKYLKEKSTNEPSKFNLYGKKPRSNSIAVSDW